MRRARGRGGGAARALRPTPPPRPPPSSYTDFTVGLINTHYVYLPIPTIIQAPRTVDPAGRHWNRLKVAVKQPDLV